MPISPCLVGSRRKADITRVANVRSFARLLRSLSSDTPHRFDNAEDVYLATPWTRQSALAREALEIVGRSGWRLVGDNPNLKHLGENRIAALARATFQSRLISLVVKGFRMTADRDASACTVMRVYTLTKICLK